ncbi:Rad52/Rad22 family DNA repair protein [Arcobacter defluvii]|uniref:Rad52/22 family double-strand break repair protein n=1 Tax=Arcobacter defluvii TaxID=873191 RepID=A0AAE7BI92_9BACT|nr:RAD52 family DNA repair protein [Arcobacter defluvii]QKF78234.1 putative Rad52/22 family double-strand break repair protein [Arcobacter defluvii]RXI33338.1 DNA repair protein Rad52 [Arcobacter defluvii]
MFNKNQIEVLNKELDSNRIKTREKGNVSLSYIEGFDVIETANIIFGYGNWSYLISSLNQVSQEQNHNQNFVVCYKAVVKLIIKDENHTKSISRQDVGFGNGVAKTLADAHENAGKEAVTDALKRAMRSFGNQFGNSLYDKTRNHQNQDSSYQANQNQQQKPNYNQSHSTNTNFKGVGNQQQTARQNQTQNQTTQQQVQNQNSRNVNQNPNNQHNNPPQQNSFQNNQSFDQYEYQPLYNLGLDVIEQNGFLVVTGNNQYAYKDAIKACGFRFDSASKSWYKPVESAA